MIASLPQPNFHSQILYLGLSAYALLKHEVDMGRRVLGFSALASMVLLSFESYYFCRQFLNTADPRVKNSVGYEGGALCIVRMLVFLLVILPQCELEIAGLVVALLWIFVPGAILGGAGLALEDGSPKPTAVR